MVKFILKDKFDYFTKRPSNVAQLPMKLFFDWLGDGIFAINHGPYSSDEGAGWIFQRKIASQIFTQNNFRDYANNAFTVYAERFTSRLVPGVAVDMQERFLSLTMDTFGHIAFGTNFDTVGGVRHPFAVAFDGAHDVVVRALQGERVGTFALANMLLPYPLNVWYLTQVFPRIDPLVRSFTANRNLLEKYCLDIIKQRRKDINTSKMHDLLALFMACECDDGSPIPDKLLTDIIINFFVAGRDTTALTLTWMFYEIASHNDIEQKLCQEIDDTLEGATPTYDDLRGLKYLSCVFNETLRLHPVVPFDPKIVAHEVTLPDGTVLPRDSAIGYFPWGMGRTEAIWGPDCRQFRPERWLSPDGTLRTVSQYEYPVFQAGPRVCLGKDFATVEAKIIAIVLLQKFTFGLVSSEPAHYNRTLTMGIDKGLYMVPRPRTSA